MTEETQKVILRNLLNIMTADSAKIQVTVISPEFLADTTAVQKNGILPFSDADMQPCEHLSKAPFKLSAEIEAKLKAGRPFQSNLQEMYGFIDYALLKPVADTMQVIR